MFFTAVVKCRATAIRGSRASDGGRAVLSDVVCDSRGEYFRMRREVEVCAAWT